MTSLYCTQGHENPTGSRFCRHCGEQLANITNNGICPGQILGDRYSIICQLAQGGFGRTYLAKDTNRFDEPCVLKEFAPQAQSPTLLQKAEELFEREANVLYKLQHPQIPRFRELFRVHLDGKVHLFLVQDYVEGETYRTLLDTRLSQKQQFSEAEVIHLLLQILPVLDYIHSMGVIHRDISPENLILRSCDHLPMLIDFGGVKQVAATIASQFYQPIFGRANPAATLLGKVGYAPHEQIQMGIVYSHSDLYALAATVVVLLTGKEPQELIDDRTLMWHWRQEVSVSPSLGSLLDKMLSQRQGDRYQSAHQVLQVLNINSAGTQSATPVTQATIAIARNTTPKAIVPASPQLTATAAQPPSLNSISLKKIRLVPIVFVAAGVGWWTVNSWLHQPMLDSKDKISPKPTVSASVVQQFSAAEQQRKNRLRDRRRQLGINNKFYIALVNQAFWEKYPNQRGRKLGTSPEDEALRTEWDNIAAQVLTQLQPLSPKARQQLGNYTTKDRDRWRKELYQLHLSNHTLDDLADAAFLAMFPQQRGKNFMNQPISQVWYALADEKYQALMAGNGYENIRFDSGTSEKQLGGSLQPGEGKAYIAELTKEQFLRLELQASPQVLISVYSPTGKFKLMEDSSDRSWSGKLPEHGFYEFVVVSTLSQPSDYQFKITAP